MKAHMRKVIELALAVGILVPAAMAQKPPAPPPPTSGPPSGSPGRNTTPLPTNPTPGQPTDTYVMYLSGKVTTDDGTAVPHDVMVERICSASVRQQVYASPRGDFTMELGTMTETYLDATGEGTTQSSQPNNANGQGMGIPRRDSTNCELRATVSGFRSNVVNLVELTPT